MDYSTLISGALFSEEKNGGLISRRFTPYQLTYYQRASDALDVRSRCCAGICLNFLLEEDTFSFDYETGAFSRPLLHLDVYEDGILTEIIKEEENSPRGSICYRRRAKSPVPVTVYLSQNTELALKNIRLGTPLPQTKKDRYLALGDSITQGMDASSPSFIYPSILSRYYDLDCINQGVGGFVFDENSLDESFSFAPQLITIAYGVNDCNKILGGDTTHEAVSKNIQAYLDKTRLLFPKSKIYVISPIWWGMESTDESAKSLLADMRVEIAAEGEKRGFNTVDGRTLVANHSDFYYDETTHPNDTGFLQYALNLTRYIKV